MTDVQQVQHNERGYTLVALLAFMALLAMFALAAAPNIRQQAQREREKEAIFRGEQVADAIRLYYTFSVQYRGAQSTNGLPTSMDQLLEGVQIPGRTNKLQILRPAAARDPLTGDGKWRLVSPTSTDLRGFVESLTIYSGGVPPAPKGNFTVFASLIPQVTNILDSDSRDDSSISSSETSGPFIGVASTSDRDSVITYYGIDRHDHWIFTPMFR